MIIIHALYVHTGLAHFCEHMLFLGTEKYPEENEYSKYLNVSLSLLLTLTYITYPIYTTYLTYLPYLSPDLPNLHIYPSHHQQHGGRSNAYTDMDATVYFFDVNQDKLEGR